MTPTSHTDPLTIGDMTNDLAALAEWLGAVRSVLGAVRPHDFTVVPPPGWVPGGPDPTPPRALPLCFFPIPSNHHQVSVDDLARMIDTLRNWAASLGDTISRLPQDMEIPTDPGIAGG